MFFERIKLGAFGGGILGILAAIASLFEGKSFQDSLGAIPAGILIGLIGAGVVIWTTSNGDGSVDATPDNAIDKLQNDLRVAVQNAAFNDAEGEPQKAAYWRSQIAVIESLLRRHGA